MISIGRVKGVSVVMHLNVLPHTAPDLHPPERSAVVRQLRFIGDKSLMECLGANSGVKAERDGNINRYPRTLVPLVSHGHLGNNIQVTKPPRAPHGSKYQQARSLSPASKNTVIIRFYIQHLGL